MFIDSAYGGGGGGGWGEFSLYHSLCQNNSIFCLHNIDSLNICMKKSGAKRMFFDKITAL